MSQFLRDGFSFGGILSRAVPDKFMALVRPALRPDLGRDSEHMIQAFLCAMDNVGLSSPNPTVGCVLVKNGEVIGQGATEAFGGLHGENVAIRKVLSPADLKGATAYVLLEPCSHFGKQPPCVDALIAGGIARCVISVSDPHTLVNGAGLAKLKAAAIPYEIGHFETEAIAWNYPFFVASKYGRPAIIAKWAQTMDGHLADDSWSSQWISGPVARSYTHWLRQKYDAILVGAGTVMADHPSLSVRDSALPIHRHPLKIVFDPSGRLLFADEAEEIKVTQTTFQAGREILYVVQKKVWDERAGSWLHERNESDEKVRVVCSPSREEAFEALLGEIASPSFVTWFKKPLQSLFVEGGPSLLSLLIGKNLIDLFHTFVTPGFLGGSHNRVGSRSPQAKGAQILQDMRRYQLMTMAQLEQDCLMEYVPLDRYERIFSRKHH